MPTIPLEQLKVGDRFPFKLTKKLRVAQLQMIGADFAVEQLIGQLADMRKRKRNETLQTIGDLRTASSKVFWEMIQQRLRLDSRVGQKFVMTVNWPRREVVLTKLNSSWGKEDENPLLEEKPKD